MAKLFTGYGDDYFRGIVREMYHEIDSIDVNKLLGIDVEQLCGYFEKKYTIQPLQILEDRITVDQQECKIDVTRRPEYIPRRDGQRQIVTGTEVLYFVLFKGDSHLFEFHGSSWPSVSFDAEVRPDNNLVLSFPTMEHNAEEIKQQCKRQLSILHGFLDPLAQDIISYNDSLRQSAKNRIQARIDKALKDHELVTSLGFPLRERGDVPKTYSVPVVREKLIPPLPPPGTSPFKPEPALEIQHYERILAILMNMVIVMEKSPSSFRHMQEDELRDHFLVHLNGHYEGQATGETFNFNGKTDIIIPWKGKNLFVAECKFWRGPKFFLKTVDQLLGYTTWRDSKTAILIFNRTRDLSSILEQIPRLVQKHPTFVRRLDYNHDSGFRFILHHKDDKKRELMVTVLVFEIPAG